MKGLYLFIIGSMFIIGCGGSKSDSFEEQIKTREIVDILYNYPPSVCEALPESETMKNLGYTDVISKVESSDVTCDTLGLADSSQCHEYYEEYENSESCVAAYNSKK